MRMVAFQVDIQLLHKRGRKVSWGDDRKVHAGDIWLIKFLICCHSTAIDLNVIISI